MSKQTADRQVQLNKWINRCEQDVARAVGPIRNRFLHESISIIMHIEPNGTIKDISVSKPSSDDNLDKMALTEVKRAAPFSACSIDLINKQGLLVNIEKSILSVKLAPDPAR
jgi:hypothetical protein